MRTQDNSAIWQCDHSSYPTEVKTVQDGKSTRCLRCGTSGPVRADEEEALRALRERTNHLAKPGA